MTSQLLQDEWAAELDWLARVAEQEEESVDDGDDDEEEKSISHPTKQKAFRRESSPIFQHSASLKQSKLLSHGGESFIKHGDKGFSSRKSSFL